MPNTQQQDTFSHRSVSRRQFLRHSSLVAATAATVATFPILAGAQNTRTIKAVIIGMGGRGAGAGKNFLDACRIVGVEGQIVAVADIFPEQAARGREHFGVPAEKCYAGFDGYLKALAEPGVEYAILAAPPGFRPPHFKAAVEQGKHVFMEKPVAVDMPGCKITYAAGELAKEKGLKVAAGTQRRHQAGYIETVKRIQDGAIGDVITLRAYWVNGGPIWHRGERGATQMEQMVRNWYHYVWLCGDHICEQHVHNLDVCNWIMGTHPVRCWGMGARQQLGERSGEIWDNFAVEYEYANGVRMYSYCGQIKRDWANVSEAVHATKGTANPSGMVRPDGGQMWRFRGGGSDAYVQEHVDLLNAIVKSTDLNETKNVTDSTLTAIMGREAAYSGAGVSWEEISSSKFAYGPDLLYTDCGKMEWGSFRLLKPPMPNSHNVLQDPAVIQVAKA